MPPDLRQNIKNAYPEFNEKEYYEYVQGLIQLKKNSEARYVVSNEKREEIRKRWLTLSKHDLKKLHIKFDGKTLLYKQTYKARNGEYVAKEFTVNINPDSVFNGNYGSVPHFFTRENHSCYAWYATDSAMNRIDYFVDQVNETKDSKTYFETKRANKKTFIERLDSMVPVYFAFDEKEIAKSKEKNPTRNQILWFPKNEAFLRKLSKQNQEKILTHLKVEKIIDISKIHLLELNETELKKFGVTAKPSSIRIPISWKNGQDFIEFYDKGSAAKFYPLSQEEYYNLPVEKRGDSVKICAQECQYYYFRKSSEYLILPIMATNENGKHAFMLNDNQRYELHDSDLEYMRKYGIDTSNYYYTKQYRDYAEKCLRNRMQTFIPILVKTIDEQFKMILWYEPTDSFFASLPKKLADEIRSEYTAIKSNQPTLSCKYFEACQAVKGKINEYSAYPNPTNDDLNVTIDLAEERKLTFSLTDISGKVVKNFGIDLIQPKGKKEYRFQIGEVKEGMYLLLIESDKGERVTQRIIKK